jgi:hypothetical protein
LLFKRGEFSRPAKEKADTVEEQPDGLPNDVHVKASITNKNINDNRYYWQWRERGQSALELQGTSGFV